MLTFNPAFRTLLLKRIRGLTDAQLIAYEALVALRHELLQIQRRDPQQDGRLQKQIDQAGNRAYDQIKEFKDQFDAVHRLWVDRQTKALQQGNYFQFPFDRLINLSKKLFYFCSKWWHQRGKEKPPKNLDDSSLKR
jgi:hypothetical protein